MLQEFFIPLATLVLSMCACVCSIHWLCQFHQIFLSMSARLESERWLVQQCEDPHFFTKMHLHTDLCFTVTGNARVGAMMLSLQEFTQGFMSTHIFDRGDGWGWGWGWGGRLLFSWLGGGILLILVLFGPSWVFSGTRALGRRWPDCRDVHFKNA